MGVLQTWALLVIELVADLAWPALAAFVIWLFRRQLEALIGRLRRVGKDGAEFVPSQLVATAKDSNPLRPFPITPPEVSLGGTKVAPRDMVPPVYLPLFDEIYARALEAIPQIEDKVAGTREELLLAASSEVGLMLQLERASRFIFRSQVHALDTLRWKPSAVKADYRDIYDKVAPLHPDVYATFTFEQWFGFMAAMELVKVSDGDLVTVTRLGEVVGRYMSDR
ncbi:MAG: hypothetical protein KDH09_15345, partial [Chrysiogenetes bacterium]|nr:hypothetical protein [Chrysiogenetes bacterium]